MLKHKIFRKKFVNVVIKVKMNEKQNNISL